MSIKKKNCFCYASLALSVYTCVNLVRKFTILTVTWCYAETKFMLYFHILSIIHDYPQSNPWLFWKNDTHNDFPKIYFLFYHSWHSFLKCIKYSFTFTCVLLRQSRMMGTNGSKSWRCICSDGSNNDLFKHMLSS